MAAALIFHHDRLLMMKRSPNRTLSPGKWAAVGGHMEPQEIGDPLSTVLREIFEETGIRESQVNDLRLQYILLRQNGREIRQQFIYTARTEQTSVKQTEEGELHWIPREQVLERDIPFIFRCLLEHYFAHGPAPHIWVGSSGLTDELAAAPGQPVIRWVPLADPLIV